MTESRSGERLDWARGSVALLFLAATHWIADPLAGALYGPIAKAFSLSIVADGQLMLPGFAALVTVRVLVSLAIALCVIAILGRPLRGFPLVGPSATRHLSTGFAIGLFVMAAAILAILVTGHAAISISHQSAPSALAHFLGWLVFECLGAAGEELYGRVAILLVAQWFLGWRGAAIVSALWFSASHLDNPGVSVIWLVRLFFQGLLLAYAVYRTGSVWWSIGYHTGWNMASGPLFGAAGSGYFLHGHVFDFLPAGPDLITGGAVGPEGSVFAFIAMLLALVLLISSTPANPDTAPHDAPALFGRRRRHAGQASIANIGH